MHFNTLATVSTLVVTAFAVAEPAPYKLAAMSFNDAFGLSKRQAGYQPTQTYCGPGDDCPSSCGADYVTCNSNDGQLHCYDPTIQQTCCPNLSGYSCDSGYYCTQDSSDQTWCCPNGMSLAQCATQYSLTGTLMSLTASAPPSSSTTSPATVIARTSSAPVLEGDTTTTVVDTSTTTICPSSTGTVVTPTYSSIWNYTAATTTGPVVLYTGAANSQAVFAGLPALAVVAGALLAL